MLHGNVVDQFLNENGFADASATEQSDLSALQEGLNQVDHFNARLKHFERGGLLIEERSGPVDWIVRFAFQGAKLVYRLAQDVHHAAQRRAANRNADAFAEINSLHPAHETFSRLHGHGTHATFSEVLLHFGGHVNRFRNVKAITGDTNGVINGRQVTALELDIKYGSNDLHD